MTPDSKIIPMLLPPDRHGPARTKPVPEPPNNPEYEQATIGAILVRPEVLDEIKSLVDPGDFYATAHRLPYKAMLELLAEGAPVDLVTVAGRLKDKGHLEAIGGPAFLAGLSEQCGFSTNGAFYGKLVKRLSIQRKVIAFGQNLITAAQAPGAETKHLVEYMESMAHDLKEAEASAGDSFSAYAKLAYNVEQFQKLVLPPKESFLYPWLTAYQMLEIYGPRGGGKTAFVLGVLGAAAEGRSFGPWTAGEAPVKSLYLDGELPAQDIQIRNEQLDLARLSTPENLIILNNALVIEAGLKRMSLRDLDWTDGFKRFLVDQKVRLWAADNLSSLATGAENAVEDWTPINLFFLDLRALGITTAFVHHAGKGGGQRGTSGREDNLDMVVLIKPTSDAHLVPGPKFTVSFEKNRIPRGQGYHLMKETEMELIKDPDDPTGLNLPGLWVYTTTASKKSGQNKALTIELIDAGVPRIKIAEKLGVVRSTVTRIVTQAIKDGFLSDDEKLTPAGVEFVEKTRNKLNGLEDF